LANPSFIGGGPRYDFGANFTSLHSHTVELDLIHAKLVKLNIIQQLPSRKPLDPGPPMTKTSFTATEMASPCNWASWPPSRFDRSSANSEKASSLCRNSIKEKWPGSKKGLVSIVRVARLSAPHRAPLLSCAPLSCAPLIPRPSACSSALVLRLLLLPLPKKKNSAALHVHLQYGCATRDPRSTAVQRTGVKENPRLRPQAMPCHGPGI